MSKSPRIPPGQSPALNSASQFDKRGVKCAMTKTPLQINANAVSPNVRTYKFYHIVCIFILNALFRFADAQQTSYTHDVSQNHFISAKKYCPGEKEFPAETGGECFTSKSTYSSSTVDE